MNNDGKIWLIGLVLALAMQVIVLPDPTRAAGPWYVGPGGSDGATCLSPATRCASINGALNKAGFVAGDTIRVRVGTYTGSGNEVVLLNKNATLSGGWDASFTTQNGMSTIDGEAWHRGMTVNSGVTAMVERFAMQNGIGSIGSGGGIYNVGGTVILNHSVVSGNSGSGISNDGTMTLNHSIVSGNSGGIGGIYNGGTMTLNHSTVSDNTSVGFTGGIANSGTLTLNNSAVSDNSTTSLGGGISSDSGSIAILNNSSVTGNSSLGYGGGIYAYESTVILNNSTVSGNRAGSSGYWDGGGIWISGNNYALTLNNSTISNNTAGSSGGGIVSGGGVNSTVTLRNTILANNMATIGPDCAGGFVTPFSSAGYNLIGNTSDCTFTPTTGDLVNIDPKLGPLQGSPCYHPLLFDSPAINAGNPAGCMGSTGLLTTDQRGFARFGRCDIGAYEAQSVKTVNQSTALPENPVTYTIAFQNGSIVATNIRVTDTLPISLTYINNSLTATSGSYGYNNGVISWTGVVNVGGAVSITFGATISQATPLGTSIVNSAIISDAGEIITRTAAVNVLSSIYLPIVLKN